MTSVGPPPPPNWYADPTGSGGQRYWDGYRWTEHVAPPVYAPQASHAPYPPNAPYPPSAPYPPFAPPGPYAPNAPYAPQWGPPPWKGAQIGRPASGPGSLASPGRRLGAFALDILVLIPVYIVLLVVTLSIAAPHFGPILPKMNADGTTAANAPTPGLVWVYVTVLGTIVATGLLMVAYQTIATAKYGRTLGKAWLHIRPVGLDLGPLGWGRSFVRALIYWVSTWFGWLGLLDPLWCLWDDKRQCLHDKVATSIVIVDLDWHG